MVSAVLGDKTVLGMLRLLYVRPRAGAAGLHSVAGGVRVCDRDVRLRPAGLHHGGGLAAGVRAAPEGHPANILALAFILLCLMDPLQVFQPGFQLSFCVFAVIVCLAGWSSRERPLWAPDPFIPSRIYNAREKGLVRLEKACRGALLISVGAWLMSIPLTAWHFDTWNLYAPLTNLCLSVLVFPLMGVSLFGLVFAWCPWMSCACNTAASWLASAMLAVAGGSGFPAVQLSFFRAACRGK